MTKNLNNTSQALQYAGDFPVLPFGNSINQPFNKTNPEKIEFNKEGYKKNKQFGNFLIVTNFGSLILKVIDAITPCATVNSNSRED